MEIKVKNVKGGEKSFVVPETQLVSDLKLLIQEEFSIPASTQKLIYKGRILDDSKILSEYSIKPNDTIIMTSVSSSSSSSSSTSTSAGPQSSSALISNPPVQSLPPPVLQGTSPPVPQASTPFSEEHKSVSSGLSAPSSDPHQKRTGTFDFLMGNAQFENIVSIIRQDPRAFEDFIIQVEKSNPELYDLILKHKKEFVELIRGREASSDQVQLSKDEFNDVKELMKLGFGAQECLDAYLSCGRNKELAANLLFSNFS